MEYTLSKIVKLFISKLWILVLVTFIGGGLAFLFTQFFVDSVYESKMEFFVQKTKDASNISQEEAINGYITIIGSDSLLASIQEALVQENSSAVYLPSDLKSMMSIKKNSQNAFTITIRASDPERAYFIGEVLAAMAPGLLTSDVRSPEGYLIYVTVNPVKNIYAVSPNLLLNTFAGLFIGIVCGALFILLLDKFDTSIKDENDIEDLYNIPLLGVVYSSGTLNENQEDGNGQA